MRIEWWILLSVYVIATAILVLIPRNQVRLAIVAFLFIQVITFLNGAVVVELGLLEYPVREFRSVNRTSFTYEYYAFPTIGAAFNVWYPNHRSGWFKLSYYVGYSFVLTIVELFLEIYTDLIHYIHWEWYITWITVCASLLLSRIYCNWFFTKTKAPQNQ